MTRPRHSVGLHTTGDSEFSNSVCSSLRSLLPSVAIAGMRDAGVVWIDGGDSSAELILDAARNVSRPIISASRFETCAQIVASGVASAVCCVGVETVPEGALDLGGSSVLSRGEHERHAERRMAKIISRMAQGFGPPATSPVGWPMEAMVEVVRTCNLRCPLCPVGNGAADHYENMSVETFREIASALGETVTALSLYNYGEPLLHPHIGEIVAIAKEAGIECVAITTNGTILRPGLEDALVSAGLDSLRISIDGATQESYEKYRVGGDLEKIWNHVRRFVAAKHRLGSGQPRIEAQFVVNRWNEQEVEDFRRLAGEAGVDRVRLKTFNALMTGVEFSDLGRDFLPTDARYSRYADPDRLTYRDRYKLAQCEWPLVRVVVNADGAVVPCCYDYNGRHRLGTFRGTGADDWWNTEQRARFRERLRRDPMSIDICSICPVGVPSLEVAFE